MHSGQDRSDNIAEAKPRTSDLTAVNDINPSHIPARHRPALLVPWSEWSRFLLG